MDPEAIQVVCAAIEARKPISFKYEKDGKIRGERIGNPHIAFGGRTRDGIPRVWIHIVQTGGVSDTLDEFPEWRMFIGEFMVDVTILKDEPEFGISDGYNPDSSLYAGNEILSKL